MRITQDLLHKFAAEIVKEHQRREPDLHAAYLTGSLLREDPLLGGTTDIDLILVHKYKVPLEREVEAITPEVSLDILHKHQDEFRHPRQLRQNAWLGYPLTQSNILMYDTDHWLEFIQSSVSADFHSVDNVLARIQHFYDEARDGWFSLLRSPAKNHLEWLDRYFDSLASAANAVSGLIGPPLTTRRFLIDFRQRIEALGVPQILAGFYGLSGFSDPHQDELFEWHSAFYRDYTHILDNTTTPVHLCSCRQAYYADGIKALVESEDPGSAFWPLVRLWLDVQLTSLEKSLPQNSWEKLLESLQLTESSASVKIKALDAFLDTIEITLESWSETYVG